MDTTLTRVIYDFADHSGLPANRLAAASAIDQDVKISRADLPDLAAALAKESGDHIWQWPWQRFGELIEPSALIFPYFMGRLLSWPFRGRLFDPAPFERLELGHIAAVIDRGAWFEP